MPHKVFGPGPFASLAPSNVSKYPAQETNAQLSNESLHLGTGQTLGSHCECCNAFQPNLTSGL